MKTLSYFVTSIFGGVYQSIKQCVLIFISILASFGLWAQNQDISGGAYWESEPFMVIDPVNPQHIVVAWMGTMPLSTNLSIKTRVTFNGGYTWGNIVAIPHQSGTYKSADVSMAYDRFGELFLTFIDFRESPDSGGVYVVMSADGGMSWGAASLVIAVTDDSPKEPIDRPWLTIGKSTGTRPDTLYVTTKPAPWIALPNRPYFTMSYDKGLTWSHWRYIDTTGYLVGSLISAPMAAPSIDSADRFRCVYPTYISTVSLYPRFIMASHIGENLFQYSIADTVVGAGTVDTLAKAAYRLICDPNNNSHFALLLVQNFYGDLDIFSIESFNAGVTWGALQRVNDDAVGNGKMQDMQWCNFDEHGDIVAAWRDRRNAPGNGYQQSTEIWGAVKWSGSSNYSNNFRLSDVAAPFDSFYLARSGNDFLNVAMAQDTISAAWGDVRAGVLNIWFMRKAASTCNCRH